jgi:hypothetical protein
MSSFDDMVEVGVVGAGLLFGCLLQCMLLAVPVMIGMAIWRWLCH